MTLPFLKPVESLDLFLPLYNTGSYDKCIAQLLEKNKDDTAVVTGNIFSNQAVQKKNALVIMLIVS